MIKISFSKGTAPLEYNDALYFTEEEYASMSPEDIEKIKDERYQRWYDIVTNPAQASDIPPEVTDG